MCTALTWFVFLKVNSHRMAKWPPLTLQVASKLVKITHSRSPSGGSYFESGQGLLLCLPVWSSLKRGVKNPRFGTPGKALFKEDAEKKCDFITVCIKKYHFPPMVSLNLRMSFLGAELITLLAYIKPFNGVLRIKPKLISMDYKTPRSWHLPGIWHSFLHSYFPPSHPRLWASPLFLKDLGMLFILIEDPLSSFHCHSPSEILLKGDSLQGQELTSTTSPLLC